ncbi:alpha/beta hydrolase [Streptomyces antimicrobicus]|uniref:Alpha/beta hydrolase n=1 Tax=Streptomyces antimicrobicus TaxID=2883108 RepID=A0ABS8BEG1_9ACTN|nr:alpha/beta hydrolase [Streptomyces antimicrobicus]MCB5183032.1 alpha/beta hydrolase [Streptomyces antimicrobicus]
MRRFAPLLAAGVLATLVPALAPAQASAAETTTAPSSDILRQKPDWQRCDPELSAAYECATVKVPLDYRKPKGATLDVAISRIKAADPAKRHGVLLSNPGGPGGSGLDMPLLLDEHLPKEVREQYDLIGFDPRGVGRSSPISCGLTDAEQNWLRPYKPETFTADVAWARSVADKCRQQAKDVLPHITTRNTARDMDVIRAVLGERKVSYLGYSYGTYLGAVFTEMFPQRSDRIVLDSGVDPQRAWRGMIQVWAEGAEPAFHRWTQWTAQRSAEYGLGDTPDAVSRTFWDLVARADKDPIPFEGQKLTGDDIRSARPYFFYPQQAAELVKALKAAAEGRPPAGSVPEGFLRGRAGGPAADNSTAVFLAVVCGDTDAWPRDPEQYRQDAVRDKARYPLFGDFASNIMPCAFWDRPAEKATAVNNRTPVLTVQNEWDSQTPLTSGEGLHRALKGSRMVLAAGGEGHGVYLFDPASCANAPVSAYLATGRLPYQDITCTTPPAEGGRLTQPKPAPPFPGAPDRF